MFRDSLALARAEGWVFELPSESRNEQEVKQDLNTLFDGTFVENRLAGKKTAEEAGGG